MGSLFSAVPPKHYHGYGYLVLCTRGQECYVSK